jgi:CRP/FNR family transcriptional regulator, cyclic AMP receptor protein
VADDAAELLRRVPLFADLERRDLERVAATMRLRRFRAGDAMAQEGEGGVGFFVIEEGEARVSVHGDDVGRLGPGDYFGEIALIAHTDRTATVTAETDMRCYGLTSWEFRPIVEGNPQVAWKLLEAVARKVREVEQREG